MGEWCGPGKSIAPILDEVAKEYAGKIKWRNSISTRTRYATQVRVRGIPDLMLFKNGSVEAQKVGALSKSQLSALLTAAII